MKNENLIERKIEKRYYRNFFNKFYDTLIAFKDPKHELYWDSEEDYFYLMETANREDEDDYLLMFTEFTFNNRTITIYTEK